MSWDSCIQCGRTLRRDYEVTAREPRFCSADCMRRWWLDRRRLAGPEVELHGVVGLICAIYAWRALVEQNEIWELLWQVKRYLGSGVSAEDVHHDLVRLFGG